MITITKDGIKSATKIVLTTRGIIIKEKGMFSSSFKDIFSKEYADVYSVKITNKLIAYTITFNDDYSVTFDNEEDPQKIKRLVELGAKNEVALAVLVGDESEEKTLKSISMDSLEVIVDKNKFGASVSSMSSVIEAVNDITLVDDGDEECQYRYENKTMIFKHGETYIDDGQNMDFPTDVRTIVFPTTWEKLYEEDFPNAMPHLEVLDFTRAGKLTYIDDGCFHDCGRLKVVVLPPMIESMPCFKNCISLTEIHAPRSLETLYAVTGDGDARITAYLSNPELSFDEEFCNDCKQVFVPRSLVKEWREEAEEAGINVRISPLPEGYSFPTTPLSEPWSKEEKKPEPQPRSNASAAPCPPPMPTFSFHAVIEGKQCGPYDREQFKRLVDADMITPKTLVWTNGMSGWEKAGEVEDLEEFFRKSSQMMPPPVPGCPPVPPTI